eukprot:gene491-619_t
MEISITLMGSDKSQHKIEPKNFNILKYSKFLHRAVSESLTPRVLIYIDDPNVNAQNFIIIMKLLSILAHLHDIQMKKYTDDLQRLSENGGNGSFGGQDQYFNFIGGLKRELKKEWYRHRQFDMRNRGNQFPSLVLAAHFFEVVDDLLVRLFRNKLENFLAEQRGTKIDSVREYLGIVDTFSQQELEIVEREFPFSAGYSTVRNDLLYNSFVDKIPTGGSGGDNSGGGNGGRDMDIDDMIKEFDNNTPDDIVKHLLRRKPETSVSDNSVTECYKCHSKFGWTNGRHHCRDCGYIFCNPCSSYGVSKELIPKIKYEGLKDSIYSTVRVCGSCFRTIQEVDSCKTIIKALELLALDLFQIRKFSAICPKWRMATIHYLSAVRTIQYRFPIYDLKAHEKKLLWRNRTHFKGHSCWTLSLINSLDFKSLSPFKVKELYDTLLEPENTFDRKSCFHLCCSSSCQQKIDGYQVIPFLEENVTDPRIRKYAIDRLDNIKNHLVNILPQLVFLLRYEPVGFSELAQYLVKKAKEDTVFAYKLLWEIKNCQQSKVYGFRYEFLKSYLISELSQQNKNEIQSFCFGFELTQILHLHPQSDQPDWNILNQLDVFEGQANKIKNPIDPRYSVEKFNVNDTQVKNSATRPIVLHVECTRDSDPEKQKKVSLVMFKKDDLRKDQIIMNLIGIMSDILVDHGYQRAITYEVQPTGSEYGFIQLVESCHTLLDIYESYKGSPNVISAYLDRNDQFSNSKKFFLESLSTWMIITHLLGVGDRHNENIMLTELGEIFHIDYGFILGKEPKPVPNYIRFDRSFEETFFNSTSKKEFYDRCVKIFLILRKESAFFLHQLLFLTRIDPPLESIFNEDQIRQEVSARFLPGISDKECTEYITNLLKNNLGSFTQSIVDICRRITRGANKTYNSFVSSSATDLRSVSDKAKDYFFRLPDLWNPSNGGSSSNN